MFVLSFLFPFEVQEHGSVLEDLGESKRQFNGEMEQGNIRVFCKCTNIARGSSSIVDFGASRVNELQIICSDSSIKEFKFDHVFRLEDDEDAVFVQTSPMLTSVFDGHDVCICSYGQAGTGKVFTLEGTLENRGVINRTFQELFRIAHERSNNNMRSNLSSSETYCNFSGGDCKTLMIVQINTSATDLRETLSCLKLANRVRGIEHGPAWKRTDFLELFKYKQQVVPGMLIAETTKSWDFGICMQLESFSDEGITPLEEAEFPPSNDTTFKHNNKVVAANCYYLDDKTINIDKAKTITDYSRHGTSCASVIAARIVDNVGYGLIKKEVAVAEAVTHGAHILSMSISEPEKKKVLGKRAVSSSAARSKRIGPSFMSSNIAKSTLLAVLQNVLACVASGNEGVRNFATWQLTYIRLVLLSFKCLERKEQQPSPKSLEVVFFGLSIRGNVKQAGETKINTTRDDKRDPLPGASRGGAR
ncbi:hypothetical protein RHSIM_RhsimUnG0154300 [Rhododendron simsii]|uniref:Kinesin motor domain-containing protein n=1 Tax=Rhododendron simsii TaxID=118357 RepID=A0A834L413_RHOSS|nr:hypothetical protein RHSIM_RhsimUnG0154300 [Rhododendron simsii]